MKYAFYIAEMEQSILEVLKNLEPGEGCYKSYIVAETGIPIDVLTVILKRLKYSGKIELIGLFREGDGMAAGSGYCSTWEQRNRIKSGAPLEAQGKV